MNWLGGVPQCPPLANPLYPGLEVTWYHLVPGLCLPKTLHNYEDLEGHAQQFISKSSGVDSPHLESDGKEGEVSREKAKGRPDKENRLTYVSDSILPPPKPDFPCVTRED